MLRKKYFFVLNKSYGRHGHNVEMYMHQKADKKFYLSASFDSRMLFNWFTAHWYWFLFHLPGWALKSGNYFGYKHTNGRILLRKID